MRRGKKFFGDGEGPRPRALTFPGSRGLTLAGPVQFFGSALPPRGTQNARLSYQNV
jgi:hypothetical protein